MGHVDPSLESWRYEQGVKMFGDPLAASKLAALHAAALRDLGLVSDGGDGYYNDGTQGEWKPLKDAHPSRPLGPDPLYLAHLEDVLGAEYVKARYGEAS